MDVALDEKVLNEMLVWDDAQEMEYKFNWNESDDDSTDDADATNDENKQISTASNSILDHEASAQGEGSAEVCSVTANQDGTVELSDRGVVTLTFTKEMLTQWDRHLEESHNKRTQAGDESE